MDPITAIILLLLVTVTLIVSFGVVAFTIFRGIKRLKFSLGALISTVFTGALCVTLLIYPEQSIGFISGILLSLVYGIVLFSHIIELGGLSEAEFQKRNQEKASSRTHFL